MKKITKLVLVLGIFLLLTGCSTTKKETKKEKPKGKCKITECITQIGLNDNLEKVNEIVGVEGKEKNGTYTWKLSSTQKIVITFGDTNTIKIRLLDDEIKNKKTNFKKYEEIEKKLNDGETVTKDDLNKAFKVNGVLIEKTSTTEVYKWVSQDDGYIEATINSTNGKCYKINGMI